MAKDPEAPKVVPARKNLTDKPVLHKQSMASELKGRNPDFEYQFFSTDPAHPSYVGKKTVVHEHGYPDSGYARIEPWQVVHQQVDPDVTQPSPREDQGAKIDTRVKLGNQVLCRLPKSEYAKYRVADEAQWERRRTAINTPEGPGMKARLDIGPEAEGEGPPVL